MESLRDIAEVGPRQVWESVTARTIEGERLTMAFVELEPNAVVPEHRHENEQVGIMLQGSGTFRVGDETIDCRPGTTWRILSSVPHSMDVGPDGAIVIDIFAPVRADWERFPRAEPRATRWDAAGTQPYTASSRG